MNKKTARKNSKPTSKTKEIPVGVVGVGVMGAVITTCMLAAGHPVVAISLEEGERSTVKTRVKKHLKALHRTGELRCTPQEALQRLEIGADYSLLAPCVLVVESIIEDLAAKHAVLQKIEAVVGARALIASNTSAMPITRIQSAARNPQRVLGLHWVSSSPHSWCVEVMGGQYTSRGTTKRASEFVKLWGKTPSLSRQDKPGFICNRVGYAMLREACALLDEGVATAEEIDNAVRASLGTWLPFTGPFGYLDLSGLTAYAPIMKELLPDLSDNDNVPLVLEKLKKTGAAGVANGCGFYRYEEQQATKRKDDFDDFRRDLILLIRKYEKDSGSSPKKSGR